MKYPVRVAIYPHIQRDKETHPGFEIYVEEEECFEFGPRTQNEGAATGKADRYEAKNAEELLAFLMGVYGWYPRGYESPLMQKAWSRAARESANTYLELGEEEFYRRLGITVDPGEEK